MKLTEPRKPDPRRVFLLGLHEQHLDAMTAQGLPPVAWSVQGGDRFAAPPPDATGYNYQTLEHARFEPTFRTDLPDGVRDAIADWVRPLYLRNAMRLAAEGRPGRHGLLDLENRLQRSIHFYLDLLDRHRVGTVVFGAPPHLGTQVVLYAVAVAMGLHTVIAIQSQFAGRFWLFERLAHYSRLAEAPAGDLPPIPLPERPEVPFYMSRIRKSGRLSELRYRGREWGKFLGKTASLSFLVRPDPWRRNLVRLRAARQDDAMRRDAARYQGAFDPARDFIYVPLHLQPELTTDMLGGPYWDQLLAVEELARRLPQDMILYVKENPAQGRFMRETSFFERLAAIPHVVYLAPDVPSLALIEASRAVATVSGTAGWEALLLGRPVILFGRTWYGGLPGAFPWFGADDAGKADVFEQALRFEADREALELAFETLTRRLYGGVVSFEYGALIEGFDETREASSAMKAIAARIKSLPEREASMTDAEVRRRLGPSLGSGLA